ncbi:hypothetical protein WA026_014988 [Henosepilachna vigintioctopunctata]|uniref:Uncharacterized protein n=1 Tax=Henosepilachna vigintioctopunctata TaxID=420089 RepID=A0AAW1U750_9CUCU
MNLHKMTESLYSAISSDDADLVKRLLDNGINPNVTFGKSRNLWFRSPLHLACQNGKVNLVKILLDYGAHINIKESVNLNKELILDNYYQTPLYLAVANGHLNVVKLLLKNGVNVNMTNSMNRTALHAVVCMGNPDLSDVGILNRPDNDTKLKILESLIEYGSEINIQDSNGNSPLHLAAKNLCGSSVYATKECSFEVFKLLLEAGAAVNNQNKSGDTALHLTVSKMFTKITNILLNYKSDPNIQNYWGDTPLHKACRCQQDLNALELIKNGANATIYNKYGRTPLIEAIDGSSELVLSTMCQSGANISFRDKNKNTALHYAVEHLDECLQSNVIISSLLKYGSNPNIQNELGNTPLHKACEKLMKDIAMIILDFGGNPNIQNKIGYTPFHYAAESFIDIFEIGVLSALLTSGADPNIQSNMGNTPLHKASMSENENCLRLILQNGGNPNVQNKFGKTPLHEAIESDNCCEASVPLLQHGANPNICDNNGNTCLHLACRINCKDCAWAILKGGGNANAQNCLGDTPTHDLLKNNIGTNITLFALMSHGADFNVTNDKGFTVFTHQTLNYKMAQFILYLYLAEFDMSPELLSMNRLAMFNDYIEEIQRLKDEKVGDNDVSYYNILKASPPDLLKLLKKEDIVDVMGTREYLHIFPHYGDFLDWIYKHALYRKELMENLLEMYDVFPSSMGTLTYHCVEYILSFLNEIDLGKLSVSYKLPNVYLGNSINQEQNL